MSDDMFNSLGDNQDTNDSLPEDKNYLEDLVGEGKKFADSEALAKGKAESDAFILKLQQENLELREDLNKRLTAEEVARQLQDSLSQAPNNQVDPSNSPAHQQNEPANDGDGGIKMDDVDSLVAKRLKEYQNTTTQSQNVSNAEKELEKFFGPSYKVEVGQVVSDLGWNAEKARAMAGTDPQAFVRLMTAGKTPYKGTEGLNIRSTVNTANTPDLSAGS